VLKPPNWGGVGRKPGQQGRQQERDVQPDQSEDAATKFSVARENTLMKRTSVSALRDRIALVLADKPVVPMA
jgi:hypothetical protein